MANCVECGTKTENVRAIEFHTTLSNGEELKQIVDDRCHVCRDDYGVIFDALQSAADTAEV
jgi:hypothetical protein